MQRHGAELSSNRAKLGIIRGHLPRKLTIIQLSETVVAPAPIAFSVIHARARLPYPYCPEVAAVDAALARVGALDWRAVIECAKPWVAGVRANPAPFWAMESLLREYPITSAEGLALMRLAEALLRVPDAQTAIALTADQLGRADFDSAPADGPHRMLASLSASAIALSKKFLPQAEDEGGALQRLGAKTVVAATVRAIGLLGRQFVLGRTIDEAMGEAADQRKAQASLRFSYDMLGEGARTENDAEHHLASYVGAIGAIASTGVASSPESADGVSIKLSALFSRYEEAQRERVFGELLPRIWQLVDAAARANINLTIDAEECDRLELSLDVFEALAERIAAQFPQWRGFGLAVQAYQTRALAVIDEVARIARQYRLHFMVRLTKGAYWDGEVKRAQELGLAGYPVFTHKPHSDISYLACARALLVHKDVIYIQFATHNAGSIAAILQLGREAGAAFEMQRLHGMGEGIYREFSRSAPEVPVRIYAPVGEHRDLLAYLVRRLLENGANSSFVHQLADESVGAEALLALSLACIDATTLPAPRDLYGAARANSTGADLACLADRAPLDAALGTVTVGQVLVASATDIDAAMSRLTAGFGAWNATPPGARAMVLRRAADAVDARLPEFCALLVKEAHKTLADCVSEVREAVDFLRYYADEAERRAADPGFGGCGVFVCISPWNFPLAIFAGQVAAALAAGNAVAAKPAEQTPFVAARMVTLLHEAGVPSNTLALLNGTGETVGASLVADARTAGVCFTGSTQVAQIIHRTLAAKDGPLVPLIAETGGLNAMIVDSTALPEQVIDAVVQSAFRSAGQRCSALRLLCVHESIADGLIEMLAGAMAELTVGDAAQLATDVGPLIDAEAHAGITRQIERLRREARLIAETPRGAAGPTHVAPIAFELARIADLQQEIFGPVLHVVRWAGDVDAVVTQINALGYGLTLGIQTRIDSRAARIADAARVGNIYVNRNMIGAVVGVQPFGGDGLSGTGPKAGGPHYLDRFSAQGAAAGGGDPIICEVGADALTLDTLRRGFDTWAARTLAERARVVRQVVPQAEQALVALAEQTLPGPTGESNTLRLHSRGVFAVLAQGADDREAAKAVAAALVSGNSVALVGAMGGDALRAAFVAAGVPAEAIEVQATERTGALLAHPALAGVCMLSSGARAVRPVACALAARRGAILPLITGAEARRPDRLWRFCVEQTLTINTAAAGGNAELLASAGSHQLLAQEAGGG
jgi:RHH-type proline utilization regulon transcriptional repressor/proline dehydrogenase/delta 1-pyrroline-5-carboxylate dehydrogenase